MIILVALIAAGTVSLGFDVTSVEQLAEAKKTDHITIHDVHVGAGRILDLTGLKKGTLVEFVGRVTFDYEERKGFLMKASGTDVIIRGLPGNLFDCQGERWWDGVGGNGGKNKPKFFHVSLTHSIVEGLNVKNTPVHAFAINHSFNVSFFNITLDSADGRTKGGHNTDAFDVHNAKNITIANCTVENQDDCLAVNSGENILFENNTCVGGHGISIGSVGGRDYNDVVNVLVRNCTVIDSAVGVRIKTNRDTTGSVNSVRFQDIALVDISKFGVIVHGNYKNSGTGGEPTPGVPITNLTVKNVRGNVRPIGTNIYIYVTNASDWTFENVEITGGTRKRECKGIPKGVNISCGV